MSEIEWTGWPGASQPSREERWLAEIERRHSAPAPGVEVMAAWARRAPTGPAIHRLPFDEWPLTENGGFIVCYACPGKRDVRCCSYQPRESYVSYEYGDVHASGLKGRRWRDRLRAWMAGVAT